MSVEFSFSDYTKRNKMKTSITILVATAILASSAFAEDTVPKVKTKN